jgi:hypothetical protein
VIQVDRLDQQANAMLVASAVARAMGGEGEIVDPDQVRADFDRALAAEPVEPDEQAILLEALGLRDRRGFNR